MIVSHRNSLAGKAAQAHTVHEVLHQEHNAITATSEDVQLAEVLLEISRIESRAADPAASSSGRLASHKFGPRRRSSSTAYISRPPRSQSSRWKPPAGRCRRSSIGRRRSRARSQHREVVWVEDWSVIVDIAVRWPAIFALGIAVLEIAFVGAPAPGTFFQVGVGLSRRVA